MIEAAHSFGDPKDLDALLEGEKAILQSISESLLDRSGMAPENIDELERERSRSIGNIALWRGKIKEIEAA